MRLKCSYPGCKSKRTFGRKYELNRHAKEHTMPKQYRCTADSGCAFAAKRPDQLISHAVKTHGPEERFQCLESTCDVEALSWRMLMIHATRHLRCGTIMNERSFALGNPQNLWPKCPIRKCSKHQDPASHLRSHSLAEIMPHEATLRNLGYTMGGLLICPLCQTSFERGIFGSHLNTGHDISISKNDRIDLDKIFYNLDEGKNNILESELCLVSIFFILY
jgi:hypothetical protein